MIDLGATACPSNAAGRYNGDATVWIDRETGFLLKSVLRQTGNRRIALTEEVVGIRYNLPLPDSLFAPGAARNAPAPAGR